MRKITILFFSIACQFLYGQQFSWMTGDYSDPTSIIKVIDISNGRRVNYFNKPKHDGVDLTFRFYPNGHYVVNGIESRLSISNYQLTHSDFAEPSSFARLASEVSKTAFVEISKKKKIKEKEKKGVMSKQNFTLNIRASIINQIQLH